jgi:hypothetical protein
MSFPKYKWEVATVSGNFYSRRSAEEKGLKIATEAFDKFISEWRSRIQSELNEQAEENEASIRVKNSSELNDWAFEQVDNFERAGLKMVRIDETDRTDYVQQWEKQSEDKDCTVFFVPCKEIKVPDYYYYGSVKKERQ